jgi:acetyltransferase
MDVLIRRIRPSDDEQLSRFYRDLSPESLHARFLGATRGISGSTVRAFCSLDHMHDEGLVAVLSHSADQRIVGHVCLLDVGAGSVEIGICVADRFQGLGLGRRLFERAIAWALGRGFKSIKATCATDNARVLALLTSAPYGAKTTYGGAGTVEISVPLVGNLPVARESWPKGALAALVCARRSHRRRNRVTYPLHLFRLRRPVRARPRA